MEAVLAPARAAQIPAKAEAAPESGGPLRPPPLGGDVGRSRPFQLGITLTSTSSRWSPPPKITPRSGTTSAKSAPQVSVM